MSHERKAKIYNSLYRGSYELFAFWDKDKEAFVVATHGIVKKTQKTPLKEILKAEEIRKEYFNNLLAELKNRLKISIFLWRKSCASR